MEFATSRMTKTIKQQTLGVPVSIILVAFLLSYIHDTSAQNFSTYAGQGRSGYSDHQPHHHHHPHHVIHTTSSHGHGGGGGGLHSFFDIALTALAFLSFGIFLLNLLLNALAGAGLNTMTPVLPTNTGTGIITNTATNTGNTGRSGRGRRELLDLHLERFVSIEALAASVLSSIDAMVNDHECLEKVFCDANKEAKVIGSGFQFMMPAYSLGASYIGRRVGFHDAFSDHLKAVALGVGEANCQSHFPEC